MNYIGLDQSINATGIAVYSGGVYTTSLYRPPFTAQDSFICKLAASRDYFLTLFCSLRPVKVSLESTYFGKNPLVSQKLSALYYTVLLLCYDLDIQVLSFSTQTWRKLIGVGRSKESALLFLKDRVSSSSEHACEAAGILLAALIHDDVISKDELSKVYFNEHR